MRDFIDSNVLMGWILPDDKYHHSAKAFAGTLRHGCIHFRLRQQPAICSGQVRWGCRTCISNISLAYGGSRNLKARGSFA